MSMLPTSSKLRKVILIFLLLSTADIVIGCCNCGDPKTNYFTNCSIEIKNLEHIGETLKTTESPSIIKEGFGMRLTIIRSEATCLRKAIPGFSPSAYACDCAPDEYIPLENILSIKIITLSDFDSGVPAGSDVSANFRVNQPNGPSTLDDYVTIQQQQLYYFDQSLLDLDVMMITPPSLGTSHQFKVEIELSDGRVIEEQSVRVDLI